MPVTRATEHQQRKYGVKLWIKSEWRNRPTRIADLHCSKGSFKGNLDERQKRAEFAQYAAAIARQEGTNVDLDAIRQRVDRQLGLMATCDPALPKGLISEGENDLTAAIARDCLIDESQVVAERVSAVVASQNANLALIEAIDVLTSNPVAPVALVAPPQGETDVSRQAPVPCAALVAPDGTKRLPSASSPDSERSALPDWVQFPPKLKWSTPTINETLTDHGFDPVYTQAALASGMTMEQIEERDRQAAIISAREQLKTAWPTPELIAAASLPSDEPIYPADCLDPSYHDEPGLVDDSLDYDGEMEQISATMNLDKLTFDVESDIGKSFLPSDFAAWRERMGWDKFQAAAKLDINERTIRNYEAGRQPIPKVVALACWAYAVSHGS
jgi:hypothetical protein